ncbi:MAG: DNA repair protein RecO [Clostridia bacterium]|nr:DNA repair protein RecO [Clostridia bacterium]
MAQTEHMHGVVIRVRREGDVMLTLLTPEHGKVNVIAKGARSLKGPQMPLSQLFAYGDFELYRRGDLYWLNTGELIENFRGLSADLDALNLASYFCEVASVVSDAELPARELVRLLLNSLHFLEKGAASEALIKGVFEWRIMAYQGIFPALNRCMECAKDAIDDFSLDVAGGGLLCPSCRRRHESLAQLSQQRTDATPMVLLTPAVLHAIRFTLSTPLEKMLAFRLEDARDEELLSRAGELFLRYHLDVDFPSLQMYHHMKKGV